MFRVAFSVTMLLGCLSVSMVRRAWLTTMFAACWECLPGDECRAQGGDARGVAFSRDVAPLFEKRCFECHRGRDAESGVRLDLRAEVVGESTGHPLVVVGDAKRSRLILRVTHPDARKRMPPEGPALTPAEIAILTKWIDGGLAWNDRLLPPEPVRTDHWAFQAVRKPTPPTQLEVDSRNPIDAFTASKHRAAKVSFAPEADRRTLIRRLSFDLHGLPPSADEVEAFLGDRRDDAHERLVDRLLASPHYGERWGRHWLDVSRWAESEGFEANHPRPFAWRYRDYVVDSFNRDRRFDEFLTQQIAGDELPRYSDENMIATGFLAAARLSSNEEDAWLQRNDVTVDIVNAVGSGLLGLTFHCAQCHNHKFDPISSRDYYQLHAFFLRGQPAEVRLKEPRHTREYEKKRPAEFETMFARREALIEKGRSLYIAMVRSKFTEAERQALDTPLGQRTTEQELLARKAALHFIRGFENYLKQLPPAEKAEYDDLKKQLAELEPIGVSFPTILDFPAPVLNAYPKETVVAEKFQAMTALGIQNSRMKDFFDLWIFSRDFEFNGDTLVRAIKATFHRRRSLPPVEMPLALTTEFGSDRTKITQWEAFVRKGKLATNPAKLNAVIAALAEFLMPPSRIAAAGEILTATWRPGGPWETIGK